ncbi:MULTISPECIES: calcium-translocating P-type ATPase, PMCA-type [Spirulina sp. CCY15215]|uniref:calcium-translocating P-type ATPase, PMCA-type n=1 Tax=Spirulina sp. CCY15215 TaxID=2767591 RepID=UPI00194EFD12|nr:calcium-translocating P-type ATPase, PMCA-type [Spirulina major]
MFTDQQTRSHHPLGGLTSKQVEINREKYGANVLTPPEQEPWWRLFLEKFADPVIRILCIAAIIAIAAGAVQNDYIEGLGIIVAIVLATTLAFVNEYRANQAFEILNQYVDDVKVRVIRDGCATTVPQKDIVVGDWVCVEQGDEIPADGEVVEAVSLLVDQAKITGESEPVQKFTPSETKEQAAIEATYPAYNLYRTTIVDQGNGIFAVTAVGDRTEIGKLARAVATIENGEDTPLNQQLDRLSKLIGVVGLSFATVIFIALTIRGFLTGEFYLTGQQGYFLTFLVASIAIALIPVWLPVVYDGLDFLDRGIKAPEWLDDSWGNWLKAAAVGGLVLVIGAGVGYPLHLVPVWGETWLPAEAGFALLEYFMVAVTIIVVAVPEGLPMSVTLSLAYSMKRMADSNNLVRRMHACETIGAATVICSDKTGTLTQNKMRVHEVVFPVLKATKVADLDFARNLIAEAIAANSTADLEKEEGKPTKAIGNATESALLLWLDEQNLDYLDYRYNLKIEFRLSFSTKNKYMATFGHSSVTEGEIVHIKGAPEVILERCSEILTEYGVLPLHNPEPILSALNDYQKRGMRTLGLAYQNLPDNLMQPDLEGQKKPHLTWLGFVAIVDPLRPGVSDSIKTCLNAGLKIKIITGDCAETAEEIAREIGLWQGEEERHQYASLTGKKFRKMSDEKAREAIQELKVLSRAIPSDKLRLVKLLQEQGEVVGVTGDGTNDAGALKQAKVGLAMGSGTAIAKNASDIILLDDSFQSIVNAIVWGRSLYQNIQRFILYQLTINVVALGIALLGPFIGISLPLTVTQMLWVNLIMDTFAALALATEPPHETVLQDPPRNPEAFIISPDMIKSILSNGLIFLGFLAAFLIYLQKDGNIDPYELSVFFAVFVFIQFWNLFNARCLGLKQSAFKGVWQNKGFIAIAAAICIGQILIIQFGGEVFRTVPLSLQDWFAIIGTTSIVLWIGEGWRWVANRS